MPIEFITIDNLNDCELLGRDPLDLLIEIEDLLLDD
jgi:hypothetical protein